MRELGRLESGANRELLREYGLTLDRIAREMNRVLRGTESRAKAIGDLFAGTNHDPRLTIIRGRADYILGELDRFGARGQEIVAGAPEQALALATRHAAARIEGVAGTFTSPNPRRIEQTVARLSNGTQARAHFDRFATQGAQKAVDTMTQGVIMGNHPDVITRALRAQMSVSDANLSSFVRTEVLSAARDGIHDSMQANSDVVTGWIWNAAEDETTCEVCWAMNGSLHSIDEAMDETHINCFPSGTVVSGPRYTGATTRWYEGDVVEIDLSGGDSLTVTPNHPILTRRGWVAAGVLGEGDDVVRGGSRELEAAGVSPDDYEMPSRIEQVARALRRDRGMVSARVPSSPEDFHGDGSYGEVDVVGPHGLLRDRLMPPFAEPRSKQLLGAGRMCHALLACNRTLALLRERVLTTARRLMCSIGVVPVFFGAPRRHHQAICFANAAHIDTGCDEARVYGDAGDAKGASKRRLGLAGNVALRDLLGGEVNPSVVARTTQVSRVFRRPFVGHVYNLESSLGWYIANDVITHNCRCIQDPTTVSYEDILAAPSE
jgi:SPP1 gp7 family putative phage head morphogenesis protein